MLHPLLALYYTVANVLYIIKLLYNSTVSMVTDAIPAIQELHMHTNQLNNMVHHNNI